MTGLEAKHNGVQKHGGLKEMGCSPDGSNRVQADEEKRGFLKEPWIEEFDAGRAADHQLDREATMKSDGN